MPSRILVRQRAVLCRSTRLLWQRYPYPTHRCATNTSDASASHSDYGLFRLLKPKERELLKEQGELTSRCRELATQVGSVQNVLAQSSSFLQDLNLQASFSVVVAGEFNAGKSTLINALLGSKLLASGALPTTDTITIVANHQAESPSSSAREKDNIPLGVTLHFVSKNLPLLQDLTLVDTPGTNSAWMDHTERTLRLLPAADLILFVTSADRPFSESERTLLKSIQAYRKNIVVIVNKMDILDASGGDHGKEEKQAIVDFVTDHASELLGTRPVVIAVSSRDALAAKLLEPKGTVQQNDDSVRSNVWHRSNFATLEAFLQESLTTQRKLYAKLINPIGVSEGLMAECLERLQDQRDDLETDMATLKLLKTQFDGWSRELSSELELARQGMKDLVRQEGQRCELLRSRMSLRNFYAWTLLDPSRLREEWKDTKRQGSAHGQTSLESELLELAQETADTVATRGRSQGQAVIEYLGKRPAMRSHSLVGTVTAASQFEDTRKNLTERLSSAVRETLKAKNEHDEAARIVSSLKQTAVVSAAFHFAALGSTLATALALMDPLTGMIAASSSMLAGGAVFAGGTSRTSRHYRHQFAKKAQTLDNVLGTICEKELDRVNRRIMNGVAPYTRFVEGEQDRIDNLKEECENALTASRSLRNKIQQWQ